MLKAWATAPRLKTWGAVLLCVLCGSARDLRAAPAESPAWWNPAWPYRLRIDCPAGEGDVAEVTVSLAGRTQPDGRDLRVIDEAGKPRTFEILFHDAKLSTLLQLPAPADKPLRVWLYYGNPKASPIDSTRVPGVPSSKAIEVHAKWKRNQLDRQAALEAKKQLEDRLARLRQAEEAARRTPGVAPAVLTEVQQAIQLTQQQLQNLRIPPDLPEPDDPTRWNPRRGILLRIYRKDQEVCPKTLDDLRALIARSTLEGAAFRSAISDGFNPFGLSDHYVSVYHGYLRIDTPGEYAFCSASDEGSWVLVNGKMLVDWPGPHGWQGAERGEHSGRIALERGVAHVEYYHEEATGPELAFLGWQPPEARRFGPVPPSQWLRVRKGIPAEPEVHGRPLIAAADARIVNTYWVRDSEQEQATHVELTDRSRSSAGPIVERRWSFGDGLTGTGESVRHIYFRVGRPEVRLTVADAKGNRDTVTCAPNIFKVDVESNYFNYGQAKNYEKLAADYDVAAMARGDLEGYAEFWAHLEVWPQLTRAVEALARRFPESAAVGRLTGIAATAYTMPEAYDPRRADQLLTGTIQATSDKAARAELLLRRARLLAWDLEHLKAAEKLYQDLLSTAQPARGKPASDIARRCRIGLGDVALLVGDNAAARATYHLAEQQARRPASQPEELAKTGSYPYSVEDFLARGEYEWAIKTIDEWEDEFPSQKLIGLTLFLRGKVLFVEHPGPQALRYLDVSARVDPRAPHVPEAVWLHANCLLALGRHAEALTDFQRIRADFTQTEFFAKAADKIKECESQAPAASRPAE